MKNKTKLYPTKCYEHTKVWSISQYEIFSKCQLLSTRSYKCSSRLSVWSARQKNRKHVNVTRRVAGGNTISSHVDRSRRAVGLNLHYGDSYIADCDVSLVHLLEFYQGRTDECLIFASMSMIAAAATSRWPVTNAARRTDDQKINWIRSDRAYFH